MSEIMKTLADNYKLGIGVLTGVAISVYILISVLSLVRVYKIKGKVTLWGMIPVVHLFLFLVGIKLPEKKIKPKKPVTDDKDSASVEEDYLDEVIDDIF